MLDGACGLRHGGVGSDMNLFPTMTKILPPAEKGVARIEHGEVTRFDATMSALRGFPLNVGPICRLFIGNTLWMSDGANEHQTNYLVVQRAEGHVLIAGLGIGMILTKILKKPEVQTVTVVEKYQDVIDLVSPHFQHRKLSIVCADIYEWKPEKGAKYDCIYFDVWADQSTDDLEDMAKLHRRFEAFKAKDGWMDSWNRDNLQARKRRGL